MKIQYEDIKIGAERLKVIDQANDIIDEYEADGFTLTLRQLYYQFVSRDLMANTFQNYKRLGDIVGDGRLAGLISWKAMEDRGREEEALNHWSSPRDIVAACAQQFRIDLWANQPVRVVVRIEKDALVGVIDKVCKDNDVPYVACRGNTSLSEAWEAGQRIAENAANGQETIVLYAGDLDPSGWDMTRDNQRRLSLFSGEDVEVRRIALNMDQVDHFNPPPNPVKMTDSKAAPFIRMFGEKCYELDALEPREIARLIQDQVDELRDPDLWQEAMDRQNAGREKLNRVLESL